jgi:hypothetical protein
MNKNITKEELEKLYNEWFPKIKSLGTTSLKFHILRNIYGQKILETFRNKKDLTKSLSNFDDYEKLCKETKKDLYKNDFELKEISDKLIEVYFNKSLKCEIVDFYEGKTKFHIMWNILAGKENQSIEREIGELITGDYKTPKFKYNPSFEKIINDFIPTLNKL